jgi:hypothetical protein
MTDDFLSLDEFDRGLAAIRERYPTELHTDVAYLDDEGVGRTAVVGFPPEAVRQMNALKERLRTTNPEGYAERYSHR